MPPHRFHRARWLCGMPLWQTFYPQVYCARPPGSSEELGSGPQQLPVQATLSLFRAFVEGSPSVLVKNKEPITTIASENVLSTLKASRNAVSESVHLPSFWAIRPALQK